MTRKELSNYRKMKQIHLTKGIGAIRDRQKYASLSREVICFIETLPNEQERLVMDALYVMGLNYTAAAFRLHYSESQVRRIRAKVFRSMT